MAGHLIHMSGPSAQPMDTLVVLVPGGSYTDVYWRLQVPGLPQDSYSCAGYLARQGTVVLTLDNLGTGRSRCACDGFQLLPERMAEAIVAFVQAAKAGLANGTLVGGLQVPVRFTLLVGHSMGAYLSIFAQASFRVCDALVVQGMANRYEALPVSDETVRQLLTPDEAGYTQPPRSALHAFFHGAYPPPQEVVVEDDRHAVPIPIPLARGVMTGEGGALAELAAQVDVPVLVVMGEADMALDPVGELDFYHRSPLRLLSVQKEAAHCINYAKRREDTWRRLVDFAQMVRTQQEEPVATAA